MLRAGTSTKVDRTTLLRAHYTFQAGSFVTKAEEQSGGLAVFSDVTAVPLWNHSVWIGGPEGQFEGFLHWTERWHSTRDRRPVVYVTDPCEEELATLERYHYEKCDEEAWLITWRLGGKISMRVVEAREGKSLEDFSQVFESAFQAQGKGYRKSFQRLHKPGVRHFVLYEAEQPVSIGTIIYSGQIACLYNIGTEPSVRKKGFGREMVQHLLATAGSVGCQSVFLQVENAGEVHRFYKGLGFQIEFLRQGFRLLDWQSPTPDRLAFSQLFAQRPERRTEPLEGRETRAVPSELLRSLDESFKNVGLPNLAIAAWAYLLHRYTGAETVSFAVMDGSGSAVKTISIAIPSDAKVVDWVTRVSQYRQISKAEVESDSLFCVGCRGPSGSKKFALMVHLNPEETGRLEIVFRTELFGKDTIRRMAAHLLRILESMAASAEAAVPDLEILPDSEKHQLLVTWNDRRFEPTQALVAKIFEDQVEHTPDAVALVLAKDGHDERLTYRQLNRRANRLAHRLQELGVGPEVAVAVLLDRSLGMVVSLLAVFKAGGIWVPLDPESPTARLTYILQDVGARVVLTKGCYLSSLSLTRSMTPICLDEDTEGRQFSEKNPANGISAENAAYIIYTSGSTGDPKGVVVTHDALANHCLDCQREYGLSAKDRVLQFSAFHFDAALEQVLVPLISGSTLVVRPADLWSKAEFAEKLQEYQLTVIDLPTAYWHDLVEYWWTNPGAIAPNALRLVIVGGDALSPDKASKWQRLPIRSVRLLNAYGPTEATITAASYEVPESVDLETGSTNVPIGRPRGDRKAYVLDRYSRPVPIGLPGELHLGGRILARGYHKRPNLTARLFVQNPFSDDAGAHLYKTGDLVRYFEDGTLEFLGRVDDQVKIRGFRIELGEIEAVLRQCPNVTEAIVLAKRNVSGEKRLIAYAKGDLYRITSREIRRFLQKKLPEYMVPANIVLLEDFPLLSSGKVDRKSLPDPKLCDLLSGPVAGPREPLELQLQLLFERVLKQAPIGIDQSFFELGGDSLQALELLVQIEKETGKQLPLSTLYQASTVEAVAREVRARVKPEEWSSLVPLQAAGSRPPLYLLHTTPGDILAYGNLVYRLGPDQPCYGFQSLGLKDAHLSHTSIEEMARYYVDLLRRFQPSGPYYLAGWCYGGIVAVEMVRVLAAQHEEIGLLALLETVAMPARLAECQYYCHRIACLARMTPADWITYMREKIRYRRNARAATRMRFRQVKDAGVQEKRDTRLLQLEHVYNTNLTALNNFRSSYYDGTVSLFNAAEKDPALIPDRQYGWVGLAKKIEVHEVPGNHDTMLTEPNVSILAQQLNERLQQAAQAKEASP